MSHMKSWIRGIVSVLVTETVMITLAVLWVALYSHSLRPGLTAAQYSEYARTASPVVSLVAGPFVFALLGYLVARPDPSGRRRELAGIVAAYLILDIVVVLLVAQDKTYNLLMWLPNAVTKAAGAWAGWTWASRP